jgi:hypothetical protein
MWQIVSSPGNLEEFLLGGIANRVRSRCRWPFFLVLLQFGRFRISDCAIDYHDEELIPRGPSAQTEKVDLSDAAENPIRGSLLPSSLSQSLIVQQVACGVKLRGRVMIDLSISLNHSWVSGSPMASNSIGDGTVNVSILAWTVISISHSHHLQVVHADPNTEDR